MTDVQRARRDDIELARVVATFLIVWFHCSPAMPAVPYAGLVFFVVTSAFFASQQKGEINIAKAFAFLRLWLLWYGIYLLLEVVVLGNAERLSALPLASWLLVGPAIHLWYLPFLFLLIFLPVAVRTLSTRALYVSGLLLFGFCNLLVDYWRPVSLTWGAPFAQYAHALPAVFLGVAYANANSRPEKIFAVVVSLSATILSWHLPGVGISYLLGLLMTWPLMFYLPALPRILSWSARQSKYMLGVYLLHPLVIRLVRRAVHLDGFVLAASVFVICTLVVGVMVNRWRWIGKLFVVSEVKSRA